MRGAGLGMWVKGAKMKTAIITGATSGIGLETACLLSGKGFNVIVLGRNEETGKRAEAYILSKNPSAQIRFFYADLMQLCEVSRVAQALKAYLEEHCNGELNVLINNAGCVRSWYMTTAEGYEQQFSLNFLSGFLLTHELLPMLKKCRGRVIMTGSKSHKGTKVHWDDVMLSKCYNPLLAYKQSKLCDTLFAKGLNDRYALAGIRAYVVDPGLVKTDIGNKQTEGLVNFVWALRKHFGTVASLPAKTYAFLCDQAYEPKGFYYHNCKEGAYSKRVTSENANRLFKLSECLCGISYGKELHI